MKCPHCNHNGPPTLSGPYRLHTEVPHALIWLCANDACRAILSVSTERPNDPMADAA
jgi:hypothetical protein